MRIFFKFIVFFLFLLNLRAEAVFTPEEKLWMQNNPEISFVGDPAWLPFEGYSNGKYVGIVPDLLHLIESKSNLKFKIQKTSSWNESIKFIKNKKAMMISQSKNSNKKNQFFATKYYYDNPIVIVMAQKEKYVSSLHSIDEKRICVIRNAAFMPRLEEHYPQINFIYVNSIMEGLTSVSSGESDAFVHTLAQTSYLISKLQINNLRIVGKTEFNTKLGFGVLEENKILANIINKIIDDIKPYEKYDILSKWIRQKYVEKNDHTYLYIAIGIFTIILINGLLFYFRLKHETTKRMKVQDKMLENQARMAAMGEMMDAVAHQWKQPLNALSMYGDLFKDDYKEGNVNQEYVDDMLDGVHIQVEHMVNTLAEFRSFFRPNKDVEDVNILENLNAVLFLVKDEFLKNEIEVSLEIDSTINIKVIKNEFKHAILNIINNSKDAFNENDIKKRNIYIKAEKVGKKLMLSICDNAGGIPAYIIDDIFKANVTSKEKSNGTGIGLYMTYQIIEKSGGKITVKNQNDGACFLIKL